jgi:Uma2 family endonuclease
MGPPRGELARDEEELVSEEEFLSLPESMDRIELIDGEVFVAPSPTITHQLVLGRVYVLFAAWAQQHPPAVVGLAPLDVRLRKGRIVQPDVFLLLEGVPDDRTPIEVIPDLIVEVVSGKRAHDRFLKRALYADAGVREYWLVDPKRRLVEISVGGVALVEKTDAVESEVAPGLRLDVATLFA